MQPQLLPRNSEDDLKVNLVKHYKDTRFTKNALKFYDFSIQVLGFSRSNVFEGANFTEKPI